MKLLLGEATGWANTEPVRFFISSNRAVLWGYRLQRCEATSGNILLGESCPFNTSPNIDAVGLCKCLCKTGRLCQVQLLLWHLICLPECHKSHSTWSNLLGILDWTKSRPSYNSAFNLTLPVLPLTTQCLCLPPYLLFLFSIFCHLLVGLLARFMNIK